MRGFCKASLRTILICFVSLYTTLLFSEGFVSGTLVKTAQAMVPIEQLEVGDAVISRNNTGQCVESYVTAIHIEPSFQQRLFILDKAIVVADAAQKICVWPGNVWVRADEICAGALLVSGNGYVAVREIYEIELPVNLFVLTVHDHHNFLVSDDEVVVHNIIMAVPFAAPVAIGTAVAFTKAAIGISMVFGWAYTLLCTSGLKSFHKKRDDNRDNGGQPCRCGHSCGVGCNCGCFCGCGSNNNQKNDINFFERLKSRADKKARSSRFGIFYRDPYTNLWWSVDRAQHGGSKFKVFKETSRGLEWQFDADEFGIKLVNKHKGPTGLFISFKEVVFYS